MNPKQVRRAIKRLMLAAPVIPALIHCGPIQGSRAFPLGDAVFSDGGLDTSADCMELCRTILLHEGFSDFSKVLSCNFLDGGSPSADGGGGPEVDCRYQTPWAGRTPPGLVLARHSAVPHPVGKLFARASELEDAAVHAFHLLAVELLAHGAPKDLVRKAVRFAKDETDHARAMARLAVRYGARAPRATVASSPVRSLYALAKDNATEGCVRETYGALVAHWQSRAALDENVRSAMRKVAVEETRHAELAWEIAAWAQPMLSPLGQRRVMAAQQKASAALVASARASPHPSCVLLAGLPAGPQAAKLAMGLRRSLWDRAWKT
jgi:hypothetical protein